MLAQNPDITQHAHRIGGHLGNVIRIGQPLGLLGQHCSKLVVAESDQAKIKAIIAQPLHLAGQHFHVPASIQRQLVVGNHVGALLGVRQAMQRDRGHFCQA